MAGSMTSQVSLIAHGMESDPHTEYVKESEFTAADTVLIGTGVGTLGVVTLAASQLLGKKASGAAINLTAAEARTILNVADGANAYVHPNHTGMVTSAGDGATTIAAAQVTLAMMANLVQDKLIGRATASTGAPEAIDCTAAGRALLDDANAAAQLATLGALPLAGGTMSGAIAMGDKNITGANQICFTEFHSIGTVSGGTLTIDWATNGIKQYFTQSAAITAFAWTAPTGPCNMVLKRIKDNDADAHTIDWHALSTCRCSGGAVPTITQTANAIDIFSVVWDGTNYFITSVDNFSLPAAL